MRPGDLVWHKTTNEWALILRADSDGFVSYKLFTVFGSIVGNLEDFDLEKRWSDTTGYQSTQELIEADIDTCHDYLDQLGEDKDHSITNLVQRIEKLVRQIEEGKL